MPELLEPPTIEQPAKPDLVPRPAHYFTSESARALSKVGAEARRRKRDARLAALEASRLNHSDPLAESTNNACIEALEQCRKMISAGNGQQAAYMSKCFRDLRECYHMITGKQKPGYAKPNGHPEPRRLIDISGPLGPAQPITSAPTCGPEPTTNGVAPVPAEPGTPQSAQVVGNQVDATKASGRQ